MTFSVEFNEKEIAFLTLADVLSGVSHQFFNLSQPGYKLKWVQNSNLWGQQRSEEKQMVIEKDFKEDPLWSHLKKMVVTVRMTTNLQTRSWKLLGERNSYSGVWIGCNRYSKPGEHYHTPGNMPTGINFKPIPKTSSPLSLTLTFHSLFLSHFTISK